MQDIVGYVDILLFRDKGPDFNGGVRSQVEYAVYITVFN